MLLVEVLRVEEKRRTRRGRVGLTQYQEDHDMTNYSTSLKLKRGEERGFLCALELRRWGFI